MSELTNISGKGVELRTRLLATVCGTALLAALCASAPAKASDGDRPVVWVELGGEFTQLENGQDAYLPPFTLVTPRLPFITGSPADTEKNAPTSWDGDAKISFQPTGSDWIFSAAIRYGRSMKNKSVTERTTQRTATQIYVYGYYAYQNVTAKSAESHMVIDFSAGKDVGVGRFGSGGSSVFGIGVRYAQFNSRNNVDIHYQPSNNYYGGPIVASLAAARKFTGVGPSLSWDASATLIGNPSESRISLDWGINGAVLFGHQHADIDQSTPSASPKRSKEVIVPNLGGFAGVSWRYPNAKLSFGYRADMFFGAMDGGIDTRKTYDRGFYGPFAAISIGIGG